MSSAIASQTNLAVNPNDGLFTSELSAALNSGQANNLAGVTGLTVESFTVIAIPDPEPGTPVFIDEHFTAAEGYADGPLNSPWSGFLADFTVDSSGTGTVLPSATEIFRTVKHDTLLAINDLYTVGMEFSFNRATGDITDGNNAILVAVLSGGSQTINFSLSRQHGVEQGNLYKLKSQSNTDLSPNQFTQSGTFIESLLGFADATDNVSDQLWMGATVTRGTTTNDWTATFVIRNLTQDVEVLAWNRPGFFYMGDNSVFSAGMAINENDAELAVSNRVVDRFFASSSTPAPAAGFAGWIDGFGLDPADQLPNGDPDNDGIDNLLEFVLNGNPSVSDPSILPKLAVTTDDFEFTFQRRDDSVSPETTQTFQWGTNLVTWPGSAVIPAASGTVGAATITVSAGVPDDAVTDSVKISIPKTEAGGTGKLFGRLEVTTP